MATIDEVLAGLIAFRNTTYEKLNALQISLDTLMANNQMFQIWQNCHKCHGDGTVYAWGINGVHPLDITLPPDMPIPPLIQCPQCKGTKKILWGWQKTNPQETQ